MPRSKTALLQGTLDLIVLQLLRDEPTNGYDLTLRIQAISDEVLNVNAGSLYPALYRLEQQDFIRSEWRITDNNRRARFYAITAAGRKHLATETADWKSFVHVVSLVMELA